MSTLKMDYKDDVFTGNRKYTMTDNGDDTVSFTDATTYSQAGDTFGAADINAITSAIMSDQVKNYVLNANQWSPSGTYEISDERIHVSGDYETLQMISIARTASPAQYDAFMSIGMVLSSQIEGKMTVKAMDTVPTINIPIEIRFMGWK